MHVDTYMLYYTKFTAQQLKNTSLLDVRCDDLSVPDNGQITSCSSDTTGVGYEGDTCSFTCNTGYELTGSDTRTCQSNSSWSGSDGVCRKGMYIHMYT